jgi:hypothetical protein
MKITRKTIMASAEDYTLGVYVGKPKEPTGFRFVQEIKDYSPMNDGRYYVQELDDRMFIYDPDEVVRFDKSKSVGNIGKAYKIPEEYIYEV